LPTATTASASDPRRAISKIILKYLIDGTRRHTY